MLYYIDGFLYVETSLYLWDEAYLIMVDDNFAVFLHSVCEYFIDYFCINVIKGNWSEILTLMSVSVDLGIRVTVIL
jgi:cytochrome c oxidase subunit IV